MNRKRLLFNSFERRMIIGFYERSKTKSKLWIYFHENQLVSRFEGLKAKKDLNNAIMEDLKECFIFKLFRKLTAK